MEKHAAEDKIATAFVDIYRVARNFLIGRGLWSLSFAVREHDQLVFGGFAIPPSDFPMALRFFVNSKEAPLLSNPTDREIDEMAKRFGLHGDSARYSFRCAVPLNELGESEILRVEFRPGSGRELSSYQDWYLQLRPGPGPMPDAARRARVAGGIDAMFFESMGLSACMMMRRALREYFHRDYADCESILDWGCGCGRVARFVASCAPNKLTGIDIDHDSIGWCQKNLPGARFESIALHPPTRFTPETFDLLLGISVFTHLSEVDQDKWLAELQRIAKPGAAVLMTIHGEIAFLRVDSDFWRFLDLENTGFHVFNRCPDLDEIFPEMKETEYYKNVAHSRRYIYEHWGRYFEILDVIGGAIAGQHDLVIMRRR